MNKSCVLFVCNIDYLEKAGFAAHQVLLHGAPDFDVVICTDKVPTPRPSWLPDTIKLIQMDFELDVDDLPIDDRLKQYTYWRIPAVEALSDDYDRILYLDTDVFTARAGLSDLLKIDMKGAPLAAIRDVQQRHKPTKKILEFSMMGYPVAPYFNAGVLMFDTAQWKKLEVYKGLINIVNTRPDTLYLHDQSLLNIFFYQNWLELSPLWNWQHSKRVNIIGEYLSPYLIHFLSSSKPWSAPSGRIPMKYHADFREFKKDPPICDHEVQGVTKRVLKNLWYWRSVKRYMKRFPNALDTDLHKSVEK